MKNQSGIVKNSRHVASIGNHPRQSTWGMNGLQMIGVIGAIGCPILGAIIAAQMYDGEGIKWLAAGGVLSLIFMLVFAVGRMQAKD